MSRTLLSFSLVAATALAQVPADSVLVLELVPVNPANLLPAFHLVDVLGRGDTVVANQTVYSPFASITVDPVDAGRVYFDTNGASLPGTWSSSIRGLARFGINTWGALARNVSDRVEAGATNVYTLRTGQLFAVPRNGGTDVSIANVPGAVDLVAVEPEVFVLTSTGSGSQVLAVQVSTRAVRTLGPFPFARSITMASTGELVLGTDGGSLVRVDPVAGTVFSTTPFATGAMTALAPTRFGTVVWTDGVSIYSELLGGQAIYTSATSILDLAAARTLEASLMPYGVSCAAPGTLEWAFDQQPTVGNATFRAGLRNGTRGTPALFCFGFDFASSTLFGQPLPVSLQSLGFGTCLLHCDPIFQFGVALNLAGSADVPLGIPNDPNLVGATFGMQWFGAQAGVNAVGYAGSRGTAVQIR